MFGFPAGYSAVNNLIAKSRQLYPLKKVVIKEGKMAEIQNNIFINMSWFLFPPEWTQKLCYYSKPCFNIIA